MPPRKGLLTNPRAYLPAGGTWPDDDLPECAPDEAKVLLNISRAFNGAVGPRGGEGKVARRAGISRRTVRNILRGETWMDLPTLYRIEQNLNFPLWTTDKWRPKPEES